MAISAEGIRRERDIIAYYNHIFGLDRPPRSPHCNYLHDDGSEAHAFCCTDLMQPRIVHNSPNTLSRCYVAIDPDDTLREEE